MATASPTPMSSTSFASLPLRASTRQGLRRLPSRATTAATAHESGVAASRSAAVNATNNNHNAPAKGESGDFANDSSDDEIPVPMKLSALTKALLEDDGAGLVGGQRHQLLQQQILQQQQPKKPSPRLTRQRSNNLAASSASGVLTTASILAAAAAAEERRHKRAGSVQNLPPSSPPRQQQQQQQQRGGDSGSNNGSNNGSNSPARKRVVRVSTTPKLGRLRRSTSLSASQSRAGGTRPPSREDAAPTSLSQQQGEANEEPVAASAAPAAAELSMVNTPTAQPMRTVRIAVGSSGQKRPANAALSAPGSSSAVSVRRVDRLDQEPAPEEPASVVRGQSQSQSQSQGQSQGQSQSQSQSQGVAGQGSVSRFAPNIARNRFVGEDPAPHSSMRVKRIGKVPGSFLSGPARRGKRRQSEEEENSPVDENGEGVHLPSSQEEPESQQPNDAELDAASQRPQSFYSTGFASGSPNAKDPARARRPAANLNIGVKADNSPPNFDELLKLPSGLLQKHALLKVDLPSARDQENDVVATFKKSTLGVLSDKENMKPPPRPVNIDVGLRAHASPERKVLSLLSQNTPHRPAPPPPPKMSIVETATLAAGAATTSQAKLKKNVMKVNGKTYTRHDCLGRGGSGKVYRVTAENGKMLALKRVSIEDADENMLRGYKGEIDLLKKLVGVDRVISLIDYEMNEEKQSLSLVMEMGDLDLNTLIKLRQNGEGARYDSTFVRFYWKEMLECLQAVHEHDIVHSDLKPANFVLVQGRLKLIDFGIANSIQTDETVNVHRETQIGTPNYMSPESLIDTSAPTARIPGRPKLMKLGKPSDIWSLGCILYQMVYGRPPFGHIANNMAKCQAIINWKYDIDYPTHGQGGAPIPPSLRRTMQRCLSRDQFRRPTCEELLSYTDPFLYPVELADEAGKILPITEDLLARIIQSVVARCKDRVPSESDAFSAWPAAYWASIKKATTAHRENAAKSA